MALEICRLRSQGAQFAGLIRWLLWIKGFEPRAFDPARERRALLKEFRRLRKMALAPVHSTYDPRESIELASWRQRKLTNSIGVQDKRLASTFPITGSNSLEVWELSKFDERAPGLEAAAIEYATRCLKLALPMLAQAVPEAMLPPEVDLQALVSDMVAKAVPLIGGTLGEPDEIENSAEMSILMASRRSFDLARLLMVNIPRLMSFQIKSDPENKEAYGAITFSTMRPEWRVINFVNFLHASLRGGAQFENMAAIIKVLQNQSLSLQ